MLILRMFIVNWLLNCLSALMENQVTALKETGIAVEFLPSTQTSQAKNKDTQDQTRNSENPEEIITEASNNLLAACKKLSETSCIPAEFFEECSFIEYEADVVASKELVDLLFKHFPFNEDKPFAGLGALSKVCWTLN
ncbi:hypothetical protein Droror1_Dr00015391 [Drosera rotundifolia]